MLHQHNKPQDVEKREIEVRPATSLVSDANYHDSAKDKATFIDVMCKTTDACIDVIECILSTLPFKNRQISQFSHIHSDVGSEFRSDTFRKWCGDNKIHFSYAAPKHQEPNCLVERH